MRNTFVKTLMGYALALLVALAMALELSTVSGVGKALADDAGDNQLAVGGTTLVNAAAVEEYPLWIGGAQVTSENPRGQGWSFEPATDDSPATLTLNGYSYTGPGHQQVSIDDESDDGSEEESESDSPEYRHSPVFWNEKSMLVINVVGENTVKVTELTDADNDSEYHYYYGIYSAGDLTFTGSGSLVSDASGFEDGEAGVCAEGGLSIENEGGSITAIGFVSGIESSSGSFIIAENAGTITAEGAGGNDSLYGIEADGDLRIDGGVLTAKGYRGITAYGDIVVNGGEILAQSTVPESYGLSIINPCAMTSERGTLTINGGSVTAKGHSYGIFSEQVNRNNDDEDDDEDDADDVGYADDADDEQGEADERPLVDGIIINGGRVVAEAKATQGSGIGVCDTIMTVTGGSVQATGNGDEAYGTSTLDTVGNTRRGLIVIKEGTTSFVASGASGAVNESAIVKNEIAGTGWTNVEGTEGRAAIEPNADGQLLNAYKKVQFPTASTKATKSATAKTGDFPMSSVVFASALAAAAAAMLALAVRRRSARD